MALTPTKVVLTILLYCIYFFAIWFNVDTIRNFISRTIRKPRDDIYSEKFTKKLAFFEIIFVIIYYTICYIVTRTFLSYVPY